MRVAALYDIHANLPALEAVLRDIETANVDRIVIGGDAIIGPMPRETLQRLFELKKPVHFIHGNCELAVLAQIDAKQTGEVRYWGTASGKPLSEAVRPVFQWTGEQIERDYASAIRNWQKTFELEIDGLGRTLFCHGTPRSETEIFTRLTSAELLVPIFEATGASVVICGHTHMQFDRMIGKTRVVNAGSVGSPIGSIGAFWALLGPDIQLRCTSYDVIHAADLIRATDYPQAEQIAHELLEPPSESETLRLYGKAELK